ncbi:Cytochrome b561 [Pseudomonas fluorescens]|uniref:Cytochrome b561 n=1 Tax=Pseudomonas fluorescens TaxID=294 RepID=A0A5E7UZ84_PSEFL|nr:cytochrome b [Pseudomonas fluorescens]VVQ16651.1 Cytochrome b561 [Pseudomonas fluorescens]
MTRDTAVTRYGKLSITLHWLMLALFVGVYACVEIKGYLPKGSEARGLLMGFHGLFGASIFALVWIRLLGRLSPRPPITPKPPAWQTGIAHLTHLALYGLMIATPILAWLMLAAADKPFPYFGFHVPAPVAIDPDFAKQLKYWHGLIGSTGYWLIGLHALAGLFHHYWVRDNTLVRMLPGRRTE